MLVNSAFCTDLLHNQGWGCWVHVCWRRWCHEWWRSTSNQAKYACSFNVGEIPTSSTAWSHTDRYHQRSPGLRSSVASESVFQERADLSVKKFSSATFPGILEPPGSPGSMFPNMPAPVQVSRTLPLPASEHRCSNCVQTQPRYSHVSSSRISVEWPGKTGSSATPLRSGREEASKPTVRIS